MAASSSVASSDVIQKIRTVSTSCPVSSPPLQGPSLCHSRSKPIEAIWREDADAGASEEKRDTYSLWARNWRKSSQYIGTQKRRRKRRLRCWGANTLHIPFTETKHSKSSDQGILSHALRVSIAGHSWSPSLESEKERLTRDQKLYGICQSDKPQSPGR
ncbi:hypothetical protein FH972_024237 [Carpinus fangiana]|uniref:Uncharacterized protein n=1 Tax=Carpinus fangiana TaxID=176857 RepID=A0A5N6KXH0_9ROSI|nr:hypothetical protein FH972_024237 [Carpinus fangiana]